MSTDQPFRPLPSYPPVPAPETPFIDRRKGSSSPRGAQERRQFANSHTELSPAAAELGRAIDQYKLLNRRRYITYEEMLAIVLRLGYQKK